ncbi:MAG TPA: hypothetical protein VN731_06805 [Rhodanobacter sp.]|nr:hypothetical protein [Rhodanobacter sp.]
MTDRQFRIHMARIYLAQARVWRHRAATMPWYWRSFWDYLDYAAECRREAAAMREPVTGDLFEALRKVA